MIGEHGLDPASDLARNDIVALIQRARLDQQRSYRSLALVPACLHDDAPGISFWVGLKLAYLGHNDEVFQQIGDPFPDQCGYRHGDDLSAPLLDQQVLLMDDNPTIVITSLTVTTSSINPSNFLFA